MSSPDSCRRGLNLQRLTVRGAAAAVLTLPMFVVLGGIQQNASAEAYSPAGPAA